MCAAASSLAASHRLTGFVRRVGGPGVDPVIAAPWVRKVPAPASSPPWALQCKQWRDGGGGRCALTAPPPHTHHPPSRRGPSAPPRTQRGGECTGVAVDERSPLAGRAGALVRMRSRDAGGRNAGGDRRSAAGRGGTDGASETVRGGCRGCRGLSCARLHVPWALRARGQPGRAQPLLKRGAGATPPHEVDEGSARQGRLWALGAHGSGAAQARDLGGDNGPKPGGSKPADSKINQRNE